MGKLAVFLHPLVDQAFNYLKIHIYAKDAYQELIKLHMDILRVFLVVKSQIMLILHLIIHFLKTILLHVHFNVILITIFLKDTAA